VHANVCEINCRPHSGFGNFQLSSMILDRSNPGLKIAGPDNNFLFTAQLSACQCSGDHGADSTQSKHAIDKQAWLSVVARLIHGGELASNSTFQGFDTVTTPHRTRDNL